MTASQKSIAHDTAEFTGNEDAHMRSQLGRGSGSRLAPSRPIPPHAQAVLEQPAQASPEGEAAGHVFLGIQQGQAIP